ncbi:MAG: hypothetical protein QM779_11375 [Propionicimonas sp.]|uniref:hypothetical protein n=1 Tax=Propionicimonas sp. TaxID=1955623 RepID=UPI003D0CC21A
MDPLTAVGDPAWRLFEQDGLLLVSAGTDEVWLVDDVPGSIANELLACWSDAPPVPSTLSPAAQLALAQLRSLGAIRPGTDLPRDPSVGLVVVGVPVTGLADALGSLRPLVDAREADVVVLIRTSGRWDEAVAAAAELVRRNVVHLFVDLAAHHTVSLGPLVAPGHGACVGCLASRVGWRWGDPPVPAEPGAADASAGSVVAGLVHRQLDLLAAGRFELADRTVSIDLATLVSTSSPCLRTARCSLCAEVVTDGRLDLPWLR